MEQQASSAMHQLEDAHKQIAVLQSQIQCGSMSPCDALEGSDPLVQVRSLLRHLKLGHLWML